MPERPFWNPLYAISFGLTRELISVQRYDQEIPNVNSDRSAIRSPDGGNSIQDEGQSIHTKLPEVLVLIFIALVQASNRGQLQNMN